MYDIEATVVQNKNIVSGYYLLKMHLLKPMGKIQPGQFVMIRIPGNEVFLRRPFSIYEGNKDTISIMYRVVGKGTEILNKIKKNIQTSILGPLGNGFHLNDTDNYHVVAGGIGIAGVNMLIKRLGKRASVFFGCNSKDELQLIKDIKGSDVKIATLDGSEGYKGNVVDLLENYLISTKTEMVETLVCGPKGMYEGLRGLFEKTGTPCQVLVEERMACGFGLCFGCVIRTTDDKEPYKRICKEGPVFDLWKISL